MRELQKSTFFSLFLLIAFFFKHHEVALFFIFLLPIDGMSRDISGEDIVSRKFMIFRI